MIIQSWTDVIVASLQSLWFGVVNFLPNLIGAVIIFVIGLIVAAGLGTLIEKIFETAKLDTFLARLGLMPYFERAGMKLRGSYFLGRLVYWFVVIAFLLAVSDKLGLSAFSAFLMSVLAYIPNVIVAALIMLAAVVIANFLRKVVTASVLSAQLHASRFLGTLAWWSVIVFALFAALEQLGVATAILQTVITGFIAMIALAGGLAFGLGGKGYAEHLLEKLKQRTEGG